MSSGSVLSFGYFRGRLSRPLLRYVPVCGALFLLAACAGQQASQTTPSSESVEEAAAKYRAHARSSYTIPGPPEDPWGPYIREAAGRFDVPEIWIRAVMHQESGGRLFQNGQLITSAPGAMGLMQLMSPTYDEMRYAHNLQDDPYEPHDNIMAGTAYIRQMYDTYGTPGFLAAYNAGPGRLEDFLSHNRTLPRETRNYVASIGRRIVGVFPSSRSQADLLVSSHDTMAQNYQPVQSNAQTQSVSAAWNSRLNNQQTYQPVYVARSSEKAAVSAAWAKRMADESAQTTQPSDGSENSSSSSEAEPVTTAVPVQEQNSYETSADVSSVWQKRLSASASSDGAEESGREITENTPRVADVPAPAVSARNRSNSPPPAVVKPSPVRVAAVTVARNWGIQVGAFASVAQARQAIGKAQLRAHRVLSAASAQISKVSGKNNSFYRARMANLSHEQAVTACGMLAGTGQCIVVAPAS